MSRRVTRVGVGLGLVAGLAALDHFLFYDTAKRNLRTLWAGLKLTVDYKLHFNDESDIESLHMRSAQLVHSVCTKNGGLYIKFGQQIASLNHILPPKYAQAFANFYDDAPTTSWSEVVRIFYKDFAGKHPDDLFDEFSREPIASASIAQVHTAKLKGSGEVVAVKVYPSTPLDDSFSQVQKPEIQAQMEWDLRANRLVTWLFETLFDLPVVFIHLCVNVRNSIGRLTTLKVTSDKKSTLSMKRKTLDELPRAWRLALHCEATSTSPKCSMNSPQAEY